MVRAAVVPVRAVAPGHPGRAVAPVQAVAPWRAVAQAPAVGPGRAVAQAPAAARVQRVPVQPALVPQAPVRLAQQARAPAATPRPANRDRVMVSAAQPRVIRGTRTATT